MKSSVAEKVGVDFYNEDARQIVRVLTGWDAVPGRGQFFLETPLFSGWREQQNNTDLIGAWYLWYNGSGDGVYVEVRLSFEADPKRHERVLLDGFNQLIRRIEKDKRPAVGVA
jgi:hypothetical protein